MRVAIRTGDVAAGVQADLDFHHAIAVATRNEHYIAMFGFIAELYKKNLTVSREGSKATGRTADAQGEHERLLKAIEAGDAALARERANTCGKHGPAAEDRPADLREQTQDWKEAMNPRLNTLDDTVKPEKGLIGGRIFVDRGDLRGGDARDLRQGLALRGP